MTFSRALVPLAAALGLSAGAAGAATVFDVQSPVYESSIADGDVYGTLLAPGDIASVDVRTQKAGGDTSAVLGFNYDPASSGQNVNLTLNFSETALYGAITAYISEDATISADDAKAESTMLTTPAGTLQYLDLSTDLTSGLFYVILEWENAATNSFSYDVSIQPSPVPLPASAMLLLGGLAGIGALARRRA
ncbi:VPLPA-CTERM sorting domain-containing protein [Mangrovicoccus algicola]|uniref:VPLPA-CTERM sorting domain-containing protein n=1 Tax=Mangrovicoccus algicola TaxID=2771008 RepID=A0A8J7CYZ7_9RHOB|nr:VPLPA-CTERM sorting domain-containing protein [Mangrovicoccus algicola]MBE3637168.1 VPLPA-CTERM sorting domain-containing protein [Mangrovicoccus algicola]